MPILSFPLLAILNGEISFSMSFFLSEKFGSNKRKARSSAPGGVVLLLSAEAAAVPVVKDPSNISPFVCFLLSISV